MSKPIIEKSTPNGAVEDGRCWPVRWHGLAHGSIESQMRPGAFGGYVVELYTVELVDTEPRHFWVSDYDREEHPVAAAFRAAKAYVRKVCKD